MIKSMFRYPGAKTKMLAELEQHINPMLSKLPTFCDAFVGGGSVALYFAQKFPDAKIYLNDLDDWIFSFWDVVVSGGEDLENLLQTMSEQPTIELFNKLATHHPLTRHDKAYRAIFFNRCCFSGIVKRQNNVVKSHPIGGKNQNSKYPVDCRYNFKKLKAKILDCHELLKDRTQVMNLDVIQLLDKKISAVTYLDPPYREKGPELYNEFMNDTQHEAMAQSLQSLDNWILSYDDDPMIKKLYANNTIIDLAARYSINGKKNKWQDKNELIITK